MGRRSCVDPLNEGAVSESGAAFLIAQNRDRHSPIEEKTMGTKYNPRNRNGNLRRKHRARFKAMNAPCGICNGRLGEIHYDEPSDYKHPLSFVIDEIVPVSRYKEGGYESAEGCARDWSNLRAAHWICNQKRGNRMPTDTVRAEKKMSIPDGEW